MNERIVSRRAVLGGVAGATALSALARRADADDAPPNIVFILTDDHAADAVSAYGSGLNATPHIDRLAREGMRFDNAFCTNAICTPSRAAILTGTYSHVNGVTTLDTLFDATQTSFPPLLQAAGYQTALFGKWHLGHGGNHDPRGFDEWAVLQGQGPYNNPALLGPGGRTQYTGYTTDVITDLALDWLDRRDTDRPFCLLVHQKAPHRPWVPDEEHADLYEGVEIPRPPTLRDDYSNRSEAARAATLRISDDLNASDFKEPIPPGLTPDELLEWKYQRYLEDYLRCVAAVDDNVGRLLGYLDTHGLTDDTLVVYTSDQGMFLGEHGWFDKRFMYEESLRMPLLVRWPQRIRPGSTSDAMVLNIDFAETLLDVAAVHVPARMQGRSLTPLFGARRPPGWRSSMYYRYWMHDDPSTHVRGHYGVRTDRYKLIYYYSQGLGVPGASGRVFPPEWELFDLREDPHELRSVHDDPDYARVRAELESELARLQRVYGDEPAPPYQPPPEAPPLTDYGPVEEPYATFASTSASFHQNGEQFAIVAGGTVWTTIDEYATVYLAQAAGSAATATTCVTHQEPTDPRAHAGVVMRNSLQEPGRATGYVAVSVTPGNNIVMNWDANGNGYLDSTRTAGSTTYPCWLRLQRSGSAYTGLYSADGQTWTSIATVDVPGAADTQDVGLLATANSDTETCRADFDVFQLTS